MFSQKKERMHLESNFRGLDSSFVSVQDSKQSQRKQWPLTSVPFGVARGRSFSMKLKHDEISKDCTFATFSFGFLLRLHLPDEIRSSINQF